LLAVDNDPQAVAVARDNARQNGVSQRVRVGLSQGYRNPAVRVAGPYDLILANILADPLCDMARDLARHLAPGGSAILAGLFDVQAAQVVEAHRAAGLRLGRRLQLERWTTLVLTKLHHATRRRFACRAGSARAAELAGTSGGLTGT
jgi:ribosomal protein L11 methyltransferase